MACALLDSTLTSKRGKEKAKEAEVLLKFLDSRVYNLLIEYLAETDKEKKKKLKRRLDQEIEKYNKECLTEYAITLDYWDSLIKCYRNIKWDG